MSITNSMQTGVSGLMANSTAVGRISTNIANANTDGYHRTFSQMVTTASSTGEGGAAGVRAVDRAEISREGTLRTTGVGTDLAISGSGFFVVSRYPNDPVSTNYSFTRAGAFEPDEDGNLRNAAGLYLAGFPYDNMGQLGPVDRAQFSDLETVNVGRTLINGEATTQMSIRGNLSSDRTGASSTLEPHTSTQEYYTSLGASQRMEFIWTPSTTPNTWELKVAANGLDLGTVDITFSDTAPTAGTPLSYTNATSLATAPSAFSFNSTTGAATLTIDNGSSPQVVTLNVGTPGAADGMTQFSGDNSETVQATLDGFESGQLVRAEIDENGDVYGVFDNSARRLLYQIPLAQVPNPDGLIQIDGNAYIVSNDSGDYGLSTAGSGFSGSVVSGSLEASNVELAEELTNLIQTQRAYSSNAKIITTVDEMLEETTRLKR